ncbi:MAG: ABC transporter permease [Myxococcota bacterium]|nr:ABC transporter permease [Myxococcota bacterium]
MNIANALAIEWLILKRKKPFWLVLILSLLIGTFVALTIVLLHQHSAQGETVHPVIQALGQNASAVAGRALWVSNLYLVPLLLLLIACDSIATERSSNRLRDAAMQPITRTVLLSTKVLSQAMLTVACAALTGLPAVMIGALYFKNAGPILDLGFAYLLSALGNLAIMGLGMCLSTVWQSAGFAAISTIILLVIEQVIRAILQLTKPILGIQIPEFMVQAFPGNALNAWTGWNTEWSILAIVGLMTLTTAIFGLLHMRIQRLKL